jgi:hypothetical protein
MYFRVLDVIASKRYVERKRKEFTEMEKKYETIFVLPFQLSIQYYNNVLKKGKLIIKTAINLINVKWFEIINGRHFESFSLD